MADNFSQNQVQGIDGEFVAVWDSSDDMVFSQDNVQGVDGDFLPMLDPAAEADEVEDSGFFFFF